MSVLRRRMMAPPPYRRVQFLQPHGEAYINTGYIPIKETNIEIEVMRNSAVNSIFGVRDNIYKFVNVGLHMSRDESSANAHSFNTPLRQKLVHKSMGGEITQTLESGAISSIPFTTRSFGNMTRPLYLFATNRNGGISDLVYSDVILYRFKILELETLVHDFVPALDMDGTPGLLDLVENQFYTNAGGGEFNYGELEV